MDDLLLSGSEGYLLLSLATSGASQTFLLFYDGEGSYPVGGDLNQTCNEVNYYRISILKTKS
jgi:hypothetical protein